VADDRGYNEKGASIIVNQMTSGWRIHLFGKFRLVDPSQRVIELKSRRLEALLAVLVIESPRGVSRSDLTQFLWPKSESKHGLRQAIYELKAHLGPETIVSTPSWCRLSEQFGFESDYENPSLRDSSVFLPGAEGEWFDAQRLEIELQAPAREASSDPIFASLKWLAHWDERSFFQLLQTTPNLVRGIDFSELKELVQIANRKAPEVRGWSLYWKGVAEEDLSICAGYLAQAFEHARLSQDDGLASEVALELGKVYSRQAKAKHAYRVCQVAADIAEHSQTPQAKANRLRLQGIVNCYFGESPKGILDLESSERHVEDTLGRALARMSRAYFLASAGQTDDALDLLDQLSVETYGLQHVRIATNERIVRAIAMYHSRTGDWGMGLMQSTLEESIRTGFTQHGVCAAELLAQIHKSRGELETASQYLGYAAQGRSVSKAVKTPLEFHRESLRST